MREPDVFDVEDTLELCIINDAIKKLRIVMEDTPNAEVWAEYKRVKRKKIYTDYELVLEGQLEPDLLKSDQYELIPAHVLLKWFQKRYGELCIEEFKKNEASESF